MAVKGGPTAAPSTTEAGIPLSLMRAPGSGVPERRSAFYGDPKGWRPPVYAGLSALARGMAGLTPLQDVLLVWERTGEGERLVQRAVASRVRGWNVELWQAEYLVRVSLLHARWPTNRGPYELTPLPNMSRRKFWRLLREASGWIQDELTIAHFKLARVHAGRTLTGGRDSSRIRDTENTGPRPVHYPSGPNFFVRKARPRVARPARAA